MSESARGDSGGHRVRRMPPLTPGAQRVLALARKRGRHGVHASDLDVAGETVDGGPPIRRLAARIDELRNHGHWFNAHRRRDRSVDYVLVRDAAGVARALRRAGEPRARAASTRAAA
jgi:hypothetical protein